MSDLAKEIRDDVVMTRGVDRSAEARLEAEVARLRAELAEAVRVCEVTASYCRRCNGSGCVRSGNVWNGYEKGCPDCAFVRAFVARHRKAAGTGEKGDLASEDETRL